MSTKNDAEVIINGKVYRLSGYESPEYLQKIATYVNKKINSFAAEENYSRLSQEMKNVLLDINIADDYFKAKNQAESIQTDSESRDRQLYDVKQDYGLIRWSRNSKNSTDRWNQRKKRTGICQRNWKVQWN